MANKLPEKLTLLRKHYGYSQGDIAHKLNIPVTEYMNWENGNTICKIQQLKVLADLFHVSLDAMADNSKDIVIPQDNLGDSINIPFLNGANASMTQQMDVADNMMPVSGVLPADTQENTLQVSRLDGENLGSTKQMSTVKDAVEQEEAPKTEPKKINKKEAAAKKKKKTMILVGSICAAAVAIVLIVIFVLKPGGGAVAITNTNRLAEGDKFTLYIDSTGSLKVNGTFDSSSFKDLVQVSAYGSHAVGLTKTGKVVSSSSSDAVSDWSNITMVAAGKDHVVGLQKDGTVVCTGSDKACAVTDWTDVKAVYAGSNITIGLHKDGTLATSGSVNSAISNQSDVLSATMNDDILTLTKQDGTVSSYAIGSKAILNTSSFAKITSTAVGSTAVLGLKSDGTVAIASDDEDLKKVVSAWKGIKYIAAYDKTYVAVDGSGTLYGAGDNTYNQYNATAAASTAAATKLASPKNIQTELTTANLTIKWDSVENANYYEVTITGMDKIKAANNSTSVPTTSLTDGKEYTISVVACSDKPTLHPNSEATEYKYTYKSLSKKLDAPANITSEAHTEQGKPQWIIKWDAVENADYYIVNIDDGPDLNTTTNTIAVSLENTQITNNTTHNIRVKACSNSTAYTESDSTKSAQKYTQTMHNVNIIFTAKEDSKVTTTETVSLADGTYKASDYWALAKKADSHFANYNLVAEDEGKTFTVSTDITVNFTITAAQPAGQN
jgi:DNA-binding XRE family transcriptional regulator